MARKTETEGKLSGQPVYFRDIILYGYHSNSVGTLPTLVESCFYEKTFTWQMTVAMFQGDQQEKSVIFFNNLQAFPLQLPWFGNWSWNYLELMSESLRTDLWCV